MSDSIVIRDALPADREAILNVLLEAYRQYEQVMPQEGWLMYQQDIIHSVDDGKPHARIVAELNGEIVGSVLLFSSSDLAYGNPEININAPVLRLLATTPKARGKGVATSLINECIERAAKLGANSLHLHTSDMMSAAISLYERLGFVRDYTNEIYKGDILVKCYKYLIKEDSVYGGLA